MDAQYILEVRCRDCGERLNATVPMKADDMKANWTRLALSSPLVTGPCLRGCRATYSDCNVNTVLVLVNAATGAEVERAVIGLR